MILTNLKSLQYNMVSPKPNSISIFILDYQRPELAQPSTLTPSPYPAEAPTNRNQTMPCTQGRNSAILNKYQYTILTFMPR